MAPGRWGTTGSMWTWIAIGVLYLAGMGLFYWLGGIGAAAKAIERWGWFVGRRTGKAPHS